MSSIARIPLWEEAKTLFFLDSAVSIFRVFGIARYSTSARVFAR